MGPVWGGRKVKLIFNNAAPGGVATGGTAGSDFVKVVSATQNIPLECEYAVSQWYCN